MIKEPGKRWGRLSSVENLAQLQELARLLGNPEVHTEKPAYRAGCFQVWLREDGVWIHACLLRRWRTRRFWAWFSETRESLWCARSLPDEALW